MKKSLIIGVVIGIILIFIAGYFIFSGGDSSGSSKNLGVGSDSTSRRTPKRPSGEIKYPDPQVTSRAMGNILSYSDVTPSDEKCRELNEADKTYTLTGNIVNNELETICIKINAPGITLDCNNYIIQGEKLDYGIYSDQDKTKIINCKLNAGGTRNTKAGIYLGHNKENSIQNSEIIKFGKGIHLNYSSNNEILNILIEENHNHGIILEYSNENSIENIDSFEDKYAIYLMNSSDNLIRDVIASELYGVAIHYFYGANNIFEDILVNDNPHGGLRAFSGKNNIIQRGVFNYTSSAITLSLEEGTQFIDISVTFIKGGALDDAGINILNGFNLFFDNLYVKHRPGGIKGTCEDCTFNNLNLIDNDKYIINLDGSGNSCNGICGPSSCDSTCS